MLMKLLFQVTGSASQNVQAARPRISTAQQIAQQIADAENRLSILVRPDQNLLGPSQQLKMRLTVRGKALKRTPLDALLAGYSGNLDLHDLHSNGGTENVNNSDGPLSGPLAAQESAMYLKPAEMAKGERILRIIEEEEEEEEEEEDFVDFVDNNNNTCALFA